jgi:two-component system cell cycle sensor histidine kinase/response regulator CckA
VDKEREGLAMTRGPTYEELAQKAKDLERSESWRERPGKELCPESEGFQGNSHESCRIQVSGINIEWNIKRGTCAFEKLPVAMMWVDTTLTGLMSGVQTMVGTERFSLALQGEGRKSVEADWQVISQFPDFRGGFEAIANIAGVAGWGQWAIVSLDAERKECRFQVRDSWEGRYQKALGVCWGSAMLAGKMAGYCSRLFGTNCWADQTAFIARGEAFDEFVVRPSPRSIEKEIERLLASNEATRADIAVALRKLEKEITERRRMEEALRESEEKYRTLVEESFDGIFIQKGLKIIFANERLYEMLGYPAGELEGQDHWVIYHPDYQPLTRERGQARMRGEDVPSQYEVKLQRKDGRSFDAEIRARAILFGNDPGIQVWIRDITEQKRSAQEKEKLQAQLNQAQKMESVGRLAGGVAHDLNNLLSPILGYGEMLQEDIAPHDERRNAVDQIVQTAIRAKDVIRQLLTFSRKQPIVGRVADLSKVIKGFEKLLRRTIREDIEISTSSGPEPLSVRMDVGQIEQVIMNLAVNAQDAMPDGGVLTIRTEPAVLDEDFSTCHPGSIPGAYAMLSVSDTGCGMDHETAQHIFEPFFTTKGEHGTGLGLATVYGIVKQHEGYISIESEPGKGTTVRVYLPASKECAGETETSVKRTTDLQGSETVLVVEDSNQIRTLANSLFRRLGYTVLLAGNGTEALEVFKTHGGRVNLLLTDVVMPDMNGRELFERASARYPALKVLYMSGYSGNVLSHRGVLDGGIEIIQKPFSVWDLATKVRELLDREGTNG